MKKIFVLSIIISAFLLTGCSINTGQKINSTNKNLSCDEIKEEAKKITSSMNYCSSDSGCQIIDEYSFGCYYLASKDADKNQIKNLMDAYYDKKCPDIMFDCYNIGLTAKCENNKCAMTNN